MCDGNRRCRLAPDGTACGVTACAGNSVLGQSCDGQGNCLSNEGGTDCSPYICDEVDGAFQCTNPCEDDADCEDGYYCSEAKCQKKLANGKACELSAVCDSGYCVDGVCCDASCNGQCEACDAPGSEGVCTPVQGEPHGARPKCDHAGEECGGSCDGVNAAACKYPAVGTSCGAPSCESGIASASECDGQGTCKALKPEECSPYSCGDDSRCRSRCDKDEDCSRGYACDETTQRCLPSASAAVCSEDRLTSIGQNGNTPCKPFLCVPASGSCAVSCAFTTDCAPEFVCEASTKTCLPAPPDSTSETESCACRTPGGGRSRSELALLFGLALAASGLRRRSRRPAVPLE
jgi:MYXO-CTERM domain-containing protein